MSASPNSIVGSLSGLVTYTNGSKDSFEAHLENTGKGTMTWVSASSGFGTIVQPSAWAADADAAGAPAGAGNNIQALISKLPCVTGVSLTDATGTTSSTKTVNGLVLRLSLTVTFNDGTTVPFGISYQKVGAKNQFIMDNNLSSYAGAAASAAGQGQYVLNTLGSAFLSYFKQMVQQLMTSTAMSAA